MRERFARLLSVFSVLTARTGKPDRPLTLQFRTLLEQFGECHDRADTLELTRAASDAKQFRTLLDGYEETLKRFRQQQEQDASDFNLLEVMRLTGKEIRHSMVLAWLLDHDMCRLGTHAQGNLGFQLFLTEFGLPIEYANRKYWVRREVAGDESIVDIEVACRGQFLIHIENKIWSSEGIDQTDREWSDLQRRATDLKVQLPEVHALFLTPHGTEPTNRKFRPIRWGRIVRVLEAFAEQAKPLDVQMFARHYARALRRFIVIQGPTEDNDDKTNHERS